MEEGGGELRWKKSERVESYKEGGVFLKEKRKGGRVLVWVARGPLGFCLVISIWSFIFVH